MATLDDLSLDQLQALYTQKTDPNVGAVHQIESGGGSNTSAGIVNPSSGAEGSMQVMPATGKKPGYGIKPSDGSPVDNARTGVQYFQKMLENYGDPVKAAVAYNWGPGNADKWLAKGGKLDDLPLETLNYIQKFQKIAGTKQMPPAAPAGDQVPTEASLSPGESDVTGQAAPAQPVQPAQSVTGGQWQAPQPVIAGNLMMGAGDFLRGATRGILKGGAYVAGKVAPDSQFTKDINEAVGQVDQTTAAQNAQYAQQAQAAGVNPDNLARTAGQVAPAFLIPAGRMATLPEAILGGAASGAVSGAAMTKPGESYAEQALQGAGFGAAGGAVARGVGRVLQGATLRPEVQAVRDLGVTPLPGQTLGGAAQRAEEQLTSTPILGHGIVEGQRAAQRDLNRGLFQDALNQIGEQLPGDVPAGSQGVDYLYRQIGNVYDRAQGQAQFIPRGQFIRDVSDVRTELSQRAPGMLEQFDNIVNNQITRKLRGGRLDGEAWGETRSFINSEARANRIGNVNSNQIALSDALNDLNDAVNQQVFRNSPASVQQDIQMANNAYKRYVQIQNAAGTTGASNNGNVFTPAQYTGAIRKGSTKQQRATNGGLNADIGAAAQDVLGQHYPNSGTAARMMMGTAGLGGAALLNPAVLLGAVGAGGLYATRGGREAMFALLARRPELARQLGAALSGNAQRIGAAAGTQ